MVYRSHGGPWYVFARAARGWDGDYWIDPTSRYWMQCKFVNGKPLEFTTKEIARRFATARFGPNQKNQAAKSLWRVVHKSGLWRYSKGT